MARWAGKLGFVAPAVQTATGVYTEPVTEISYKGDIVRESRGVTRNNLPNPDVYIRMAISVIPGKVLRENIASLRYAEYLGQKWSVTSCEVQGQKFVLNLGDLYA
jgi:hypothetical protein